MKAKVTVKNYLTLPDGFYTAAPNLLYVVRGNTRRFVFRYMVDGKRRDKSIGPVSKVDLTQAKSTAKEFLGRLASGLPLTQSTKERLAEEYSRVEIPSFKSLQNKR